METKSYKLKNNDQLVLREAELEDAKDMLRYIRQVSQESENLTFTANEFNVTVEKQEEILKNSNESLNDLYLLGLIDNEIVSSINYVGGKRSRIKHFGEFGMAVRKEKWNLGIGGLMIDALFDWAERTKIIRKINLKVRIDNEAAVHLYENKGFKTEGKISRGFSTNSGFVDLVCMGIEI